MRIHIVNPFSNAHGGSERRALALYEELRGHADVSLWSDAQPHPGLASYPIERILAREGSFPQGGVLVIVGAYFDLEPWLADARPERAVLVYNTFFKKKEWKFRTWNALRRVASPELVYASRLIADWVGLPGTVQTSLIDTAAFAPESCEPRAEFVVGRLSRDVPEKHHPHDPDLYRRLTAMGCRVRIMGGTSVAQRLEGIDGIELLPEGAEPAPQFLRSLGCFLYRTSLDWMEPAGRVVSEAMSCALPVVCGRHGGYAEWIDHCRSGFLFDGNDDALAIVRTLRDDAALRQRIGGAARETMLAMHCEAARREIVEYYVAPRPRPQRAARARRIEFAWELGGHTGHVTTLLPIARAMQASGHEVRFLLRELHAGADLDGAAEIAREAAPIWVGPITYPNPLNFGEILHNFGYQHAHQLRQLVDAWRERLRHSHAVIANVAPVAHIAARTLGIPSFEISQGFHIPPPAMPSPPLRDWEPAPRAQLEAADGRVLDSINSVLDAYGASRIQSIGDIFAGRAMLLTYPELDIYPERGPADYYGIPRSGEGKAVPQWPPGNGARAFGYLYHYCPELDALLTALEALDMPTLLFCRGVDPKLRQRHAGASVRIMDEPMSVSRLLGQADMVVCHGSHQMTAQALLAGKPLLALPTQLEQFLTTRRVVRYGAGLGIAPDVAQPDFRSALAELARNPKYAGNARRFAQRYAGHDRDAALATMIARCESALLESA